MATIKPRRGTSYPASGLSENELAVDTTNKRVYVGSAGGSGITVASHITDYVVSLNGSTGTVTNVAFTNAAQTFTQGQTFNSAIANTVDVISDSNGIGLRVASSGQGRAGGIRLGRSSTASLNTLLYQSDGTFNIYAGYTAAGSNIPIFAGNTASITFKTQSGRIDISSFSLPSSASSIRLYTGDEEVASYYCDVVAPSPIFSNVTQTLPNISGTLLNTASSYVSGICGATGAITLSAGSNMTITKSGNTFTFASSGSGFTYAASAPGTASVGDRWIDSDTGKEYVYVDDGNSSQWMEPVSSNGLTGVTYNSSTNTLQFNSTVVAPNLMSLTFTPLENQPPASNYATVDTRNGIMVLEFDASTDESATFVSIMPQTAILTNGLKIRINWMADTATSGTCRWGAQIERMNTDLDSDSFDTAATAGSTTNATSGIITTTEITITTIDSVAVGEPFRLKIYRDADGTSGTDDMTGDAQLVSVEIRSVG